jgi:Protein of unknown function (DUF3419)
MLRLTAATQRATATRLAAAVHRNRMLSREGVLERIFTLAFRGLVYPQIWEDPAVDLAALQIRPTDHVLAIGSGGCAYSGAFGAARMMGGADGKRLTGRTTACRRDQTRRHGRCASGTRLHSDRQSGSGPMGRDGRSDRIRPARTQA